MSSPCIYKTRSRKSTAYITTEEHLLLFRIFSNIGLYALALGLEEPWSVRGDTDCRK